MQKMLPQYAIILLRQQSHRSRQIRPLDSSQTSPPQLTTINQPQCTRYAPKRNNRSSEDQWKTIDSRENTKCSNPGPIPIVGCSILVVSIHVVNTMKPPKVQPTRKKHNMSIQRDPPWKERRAAVNVRTNFNSKQSKMHIRLTKTTLVVAMSSGRSCCSRSITQCCWFVCLVLFLGVRWVPFLVICDNNRQQKSAKKTPTSMLLGCSVGTFSSALIAILCMCVCVCMYVWDKTYRNMQHAFKLEDYWPRFCWWCWSDGCGGDLNVRESVDGSQCIVREVTSLKMTKLHSRLIGDLVVEVETCSRLPYDGGAVSRGVSRHRLVVRTSAIESRERTYPYTSE